MNTVTLPDGPSLPRFVQGGMAIAAPLWMMRRLRERYGSAFRINVPIFGEAVVISDPAEVKQLFMTSPEIADILDFNLGLVLGPNSFFAISGDAHRKQRKLLTPPFHGRRLRAYEAIIEQEAVREMAAWPEGREFATLGPMMRITLNAILRAVFGADGAELAELRTLLPADGQTRLAARRPADSAYRPGPVEPVGPGVRLPPRIRRDHRPADRGRPPGSPAGRA